MSVLLRYTGRKEVNIVWFNVLLPRLRPLTATITMANAVNGIAEVPIIIIIIVIVIISLALCLCPPPLENGHGRPTV